MRFVDGDIVLTNFGEVDALDSALVTAHKYEGNSDPETGHFITVSPLLGKLALSRGFRYDAHFAIVREIDELRDEARTPLSGDLKARVLELTARAESMGDTPLEVTISSDEIPEAAEALRQTVITYLKFENDPDIDIITIDESSALRHSETAIKLFALMTT